MDRYFTLVIVAKWALEKKITKVATIRLDRKVATMRIDRKGIPKEIKSLESREERSVLHVFDSDEKFLLALYIDKKMSGKKNVVFLSTTKDE